MKLSLVKITCSNLKLGMYISSLDRPWLETPFLLQGFEIHSQSDIDRVREYCDYVYVDKALSSKRASVYLRTLPGEESAATSRPKRFSREAIAAVKPERKMDYQDTATWREELPRAKRVINKLTTIFHDLLADEKNAYTLDLPRISKVVVPLVESIVRNPDACIWLARIKSRGDYSYRHSLGCAIWSVVLGRQLGMPESDLNKLALGGMLFDIGKTLVDPKLLDKPARLSHEEFEQIKQHVPLGVEALKSGGNVDPDILDMVAHHHERHNGSGYPRGLREGAIPVFARIAAIADCYDAITNTRPYAQALSPSAAIKKIYEFKNQDFQGELVEEFIQAIGIYPAGTLVELSSGEIAIVVAETRSRRLHPKVLVLLNAYREPLQKTVYLDLASHETEAGERLNIIKSLEPDAFEVDITALGL